MGVVSDFMNWVRVGRNRPTLPQIEGSQMPVRGGKGGELYALSLVPTKHLLADEGSYFVLTNPTIGTGVAYALQTAFSNVAGCFQIQNLGADDPALLTRVFPDVLKLILTAAPATTVALHYAMHLEQQAVTVRTPTAQSVNAVPVNVNPAGPKSNAVVYSFSAGTMTVPAAGASARIVARGVLPTGLGILGDEYVIQFGGVDQQNRNPLSAVRATDVGRIVASAPPIVIPPGWQLTIYLWWVTATTTAPSFEWELGLFERA